MRITNTMMVNQTLQNVAKSKKNLATLENQVSTEKKITRPSDDPIIAIRALSLRASLAEIDQYLNHNIPDAEAWLSVTEGALDDIDTILSDIYQYCDQGASDEFTIEDRSAIIEVLQQYKQTLYGVANTDYSGRYIFSGYKTSTSFTFLTDAEANVNYRITQTLSGSDIDTTDVMKRSVEVTTAEADTLTTISAADYPEAETVYRLRLAYSGCTSIYNSDGSVNSDVAFSITVDGTEYDNIQCMTKQDYEELISAEDYDSSADDTIYYIYDSGELLFSSSLYSTLRNAQDISVTYEKNGFTAGEVRPEMYFDCVDITDADEAHWINYTHRTDEAISYTINFNQSMQVNTLGCDTLSYDIGRDIDDMCNALQAVMEIEEKIAQIKEMQSSSVYSSDSDQEALESMLAAAEQEYDYALNYMESLFSKGLTKVKEYQQVVDLQLADLGARSTKLSLTKSRLTEQYTTFDDLKSKNEDVDLEDVVINWTSAQTLYQAALTAAADVVKQSLLNYI